MQVVLGVERRELAWSPGSASGSWAPAPSHSPPPPPPHCLSSRAQTCCGQPVRPLVFLSLLLTVLFKISFWAEGSRGGEKWKEKIQRGDWIHATPALPGPEETLGPGRRDGRREGFKSWTPWKNDEGWRCPNHRPGLHASATLNYRIRKFINNHPFSRRLWRSWGAFSQTPARCRGASGGRRQIRVPCFHRNPRSCLLGSWGGVLSSLAGACRPAVLGLARQCLAPQTSGIPGFSGGHSIMQPQKRPRP